MTKLLMNPALETQSDGQGLVLHLGPWHRSMSATAFQHGLLRCFDRPKSMDEVLEEKPFQRDLSRAFLIEAWRLGFLVEVDAEGGAVLPPLCDPQQRFANVPAWRAEAPAPFAIVGVPWDRDVTGRAGARFGPHAVREGSLGARYQVDPVTLEPRGFWDYAAGELLLRGVELADAGDVLVHAGEAAARVRARLTEVVALLWRAGSMPVVIGGDHSITRPILAALDAAPVAGPVHIVHLDAHTDLGELVPGAGLHHGNVMRAILEDVPRIEGIHQIGLRGIVDAGTHEAHARVHQLGMDGVRGGQLDDFIAGIPRGATCWLSVDIDVADPAFAPSTGTPVPGGLFPHELKGLVRRLARERAFIGMDLVEVAEPHGPSDGTGALAAACILTFIAGIVHSE